MTQNVAVLGQANGMLNTAEGGIAAIDTTGVSPITVGEMGVGEDSILVVDTSAGASPKQDAGDVWLPWHRG